jgi:two-component system, OmpR family, sensor histidine kinase BaeS
VATLGLRPRLVAAFVGIAALTTLVAALLTSIGLHRSFDGYVERRAEEAARSAMALSEQAYAGVGRWTPATLDLLAHELVLTGYDFRLVDDGRVLIDTTKLEQAGRGFRAVARLPVRAPGGRQVATLEQFALGPGGSMPADDELRGELDRAHLLAALIAGLIAIAAGLVVAGRLSRPLRHLAAAARGIASGRSTPAALAGGSREVRELADALGGLADDLDRQRRARQQLAQDLSHELRTPLMLLQSRIEAMQDGVVPFEPDGLAALHVETLRLGRLVGQIERLAEAEARPRPIRPEELALDELARESHRALTAAFELRGLSLELEAEPVTAWADRDAVHQITANLLTNALKYAPDRGPVLLTTSREEEWAVLRVQNGGEPPPEGERLRLFERFYRGGRVARATGGAGLGLTIARELAEAQGGALELEHADALDGTSFVLRLPAGPRPARQGDEPSNRTEEGGVPPRRGEGFPVA